MSNRKWCAIDAEGDVGNKGLLGVAFYSDVLQDYIESKEDIVAALRYHASHEYTFIAHNASYDIPVIFWQLKIPMKTVYYNGRFNHGEWRFATSKPCAQVWDSGAISGIRRLSDLGAGIGYPKYPTPQRLLGIDPNRYEWFCDLHSKGECESCYAIRDAEIPYRFMQQLQEVLGIWSVHEERSIAGIAMNTWKALDRPENISLRGAKVEKLGRAAYFGGRVETFKLGRIQNVYSADVTSMYPAAMKETPYPDPKHMLYATHTAVENIPWQYEGVAEVDITVPSMYLPPLPFTWHGERIFPIGRFVGCWTLHELRYALSLGCIINDCKRIAFSTNVVRPFEYFIGTLWELRQDYIKKKDSRALFAKLVMNNLYGRIGMNATIERQDIAMLAKDKSIESIRKMNWKAIGDDIFTVRSREMYFENNYRNVIWAAQTTAAARVKLHQYMMLQGDNLLYCDTDSVFSRAPIVGTGEGLGQLKQEGEYEEMIISAPKLYAVKYFEKDMPDKWHTDKCAKHHIVRCDDCRWKAKAKGVPKDFALDYLRHGVATFEHPIKPTEQGTRRKPAGTWVHVTRRHHLRPHRRTPINPAALESDYGLTDTLPSSIGPSP